MILANFKSRQSGFSSIVLIMFILLVIIGAGAYYLGSQKNQVPKINLDENVSNTSDPIPEDVRDTKNDTKKEWITYTNNYYAYTISYPYDWILMQENDGEGNARIKLTTLDATKAAFSARMLPELYITLTSPYSTSGDICTNQYCTEFSSPLEAKIKGQVYLIPITVGEVVQDNTRQFDFYAFSFVLPGKKVSVDGYSEPLELLAVASYKTTEEGDTISSILSTLDY